MAIYKALLKHGYSGFRLEILEECSVDILIQREQFYFDKFKPEYNILNTAGSPLGYRHSEAAKKLIGEASKNRKVSELTRNNKREALLGKIFDKERLEKMSLSNRFRFPVILTNLETGEIKEFSSMTEAGKYLGISRVTVKKYLLNYKPYQGYKISIDSTKDSLIVDKSSVQQQLVLLTDKITGKIFKFTSITAAAKFMEVSRRRLWYFFNKINNEDESIKGYVVSKIMDTQLIVNRKLKTIEVTNVETNEVTIYPSIFLAAKALNVTQGNLSRYLSQKRNIPYKKKYILKLI